MPTLLATSNPIELAIEKAQGFLWWLIPAGILVLVFNYYFNKLLKRLGPQKKGRRNRR